jgi:hypothetical protein
MGNGAFGPSVDEQSGGRSAGGVVGEGAKNIVPRPFRVVNGKLEEFDQTTNIRSILSRTARYRLALSVRRLPYFSP